MWFLRKKQKIENNVLPELSEYEALEELVQRLEQTPILSKEEQTKKQKKIINNFLIE
jgi:hypothetical protein